MTQPLNAISVSFCEPHKLVSLADMIRFHAKALYDILDQLSMKQEELAGAARQRGADATLTPQEEIDIQNLLSDLEDQCVPMQMDGIPFRIKQIRHRIEGTLPPSNVSTVQTGLQDLTNAVFEALGNHLFAYIPFKLKEYFEKSDLFGSDVSDAFPDVKSDVKEAGNCIAADLNTAAVFHLMRVAEIGLRAVAKELGVQTEHDIEYENWNTVIKACDDKVDKLQTPRGPQRDKELEFYHSMIRDLKACKDTWRNVVSHARESYGHHEALAAKGHVEDMMQKLAKWRQK